MIFVGFGGVLFSDFYTLFEFIYFQFHSVYFFF